MVVVTSDVPPAGPSQTPQDVLEASLSATAVVVASTPGHHGHVVRNVLIGSGLAVGLGLGLYFGTRGGGNGTCKPGSPNCR